MPRNRYIRQVRKLDRKQIEHQEKELIAIEKRLRNQAAESMEVPLLNESKVRRSARVEQKRRHKATRPTGVRSSGQK